MPKSKEVLKSKEFEKSKKEPSREKDSSSPSNLKKTAERPSLHLSKVLLADESTNATYSISLPDDWGAMFVVYEQNPPQPDNGNRDLQLLFRIDEGDDAAEERMLQEQLTTLKTSFLLPSLTEKTPKMSPPISKFVTAKWDEWRYLKKGSETVIFEVPQMSSRSEPEIAMIKDIHHRRTQFDAMLAKIAKNASPLAAPVAPTTTPIPVIEKIGKGSDEEAIHSEEGNIEGEDATPDDAESGS